MPDQLDAPTRSSPPVPDDATHFTQWINGKPTVWEKQGPEWVQVSTVPQDAVKLAEWHGFAGQVLEDQVASQIPPGPAPQKLTPFPDPIPFSSPGAAGSQERK